MLYILDTDICSYIIKERSVALYDKLSAVPIEQIAVSIVTFAELLYGVKRSESTKVNRQIIDDFTRHLSILPWGEKAAEHYADIRTLLEKKGEKIGNMAMMIGSHARSLGATVITNNMRHFTRIDHLYVENWNLD